MTGFGATAIRSIRISTRPPGGVRGTGAEVSYIASVPTLAPSRAVYRAEAEWQEARVTDSYAWLASREPLPPVAWWSYSFAGPAGRVLNDMGSHMTDYLGYLPTPPPNPVVARRIRSDARATRFHIVSLHFVHPSISMPVVVASVEGGHTALAPRIDRFLRFLPAKAENLGYLQLDSACGRPIYARGEGIAVDPRWLRLGSDSTGPPAPGTAAAPPRLTYPC